MQFHKEQLLLYAVTDRKQTKLPVFLKQITDALEGGATMLQLREKNLDEASFIEEAIRVRELCHSYHVPLIINDNADVALKSGADGVHVGITDKPVAEIRKKTGRGFIIGATAKTKEQAIAAEAAGADYLGVGAVFPSKTKQNAIRITKEELNAICTSVSIPAVAIGGISLANISELKGSGMNGAAVVSSLFAADDIKKAAADLKTAIRSIL